MGLSPVVRSKALRGTSATVSKDGAHHLPQRGTSAVSKDGAHHLPQRGTSAAVSKDGEHPPADAASAENIAPKSGAATALCRLPDPVPDPDPDPDPGPGPERRAARRHLRSFALASLLLPALACAPMMGPSGPSNGAVTPPATSASHTHDESDASAPRPTLPVEHAQGVDCPVTFADSDAVLARVGDVVITACDVVLADRHDRREGLSVRTPQQILRALVDDALLADAARLHTLDRDPTVQRRTREVLADAIVQSETRARAAGSQPDDAALHTYYDAHTTDFTFDERVHLREIVVATEQEARDVLRDAPTTPFEALLTRSRSTDSARDQGDLGLVPRGGNDRVPAPIATAAFALTEPQAWVAEPIRVESSVPVGHHGRTRREVSWHVVQYLGTVPERVLSFDEVRDVIRHRLAFGRTQTERAAVMQELTTHARSSTEVRFDMRAIGRVRLHRDPPVPDERPARRHH